MKIQTESLPKRLKSLRAATPSSEQVDDLFASLTGDDNEKAGKLLLALLLERGMSGRDLSDKLKVDESTVGKWTHGGHLPIDRINAIKEALDLSYERAGQLAALSIGETWLLQHRNEIHKHGSYRSIDTWLKTHINLEEWHPATDLRPFFLEVLPEEQRAAWMAKQIDSQLKKDLQKAAGITSPQYSSEKEHDRLGCGPNDDPTKPYHHQLKPVSPEEAEFNIPKPVETPKLRTLPPGMIKKGGI